MKEKTTIYERLVYLLPRKFLYWCVIRAWAIASTEKYTNKTPYEINWEMVCKYLEENKNGKMSKL
jgi:hypothetical protein